ncbi:hypothetical protein D3C86_1871210 [compost metagenome]
MVSERVGSACPRREYSTSAPRIRMLVRSILAKTCGRSLSFRSAGASGSKPACLRPNAVPAPSKALIREPVTRNQPQRPLVGGFCCGAAFLEGFCGVVITGVDTRPGR